MPRELVTRGSRFFCVSLTPDICKTPVGAATPPIPYMIKGEFSEATGISNNIRSNGEYVVKHASTVIPTVKGDEPGTAKGVKSGTVGKRVQHDQKSSTVSFNGERAIREGDTVFMNDKNTKGKVMQRGGGGSAPASFGDKFDAAMDSAANGIRNAEAALNAQVARLAQTELGGKALAALSSVAEATELTALKEKIASQQAKTMDAAENIGGKGIGIAASLTVAALSIIPTNAVELIPGGGKILGKGAKIARTAGKAAKAERTGSKAVPAAHTGGIATRSGTSAKSGSAPPAKGNDGGKSRGKGKKEKKDKPSSCCPKNAGPGGKRTSSRHPVHFGTGEEVLQQTDFVVGGAIPVVWTRCYRSGSATEDWGILGARWGSPFTARLSIAQQGIVYHDDTGRALRLPHVEPGAQFDHRGEGFILSRPDTESFTLTWRDGSRDHFSRGDMAWLPHGYHGVNAMLPPGPPEPCECHVLRRSEDAGGRGFDIERAASPSDRALLRITTDDGRIVEAIRLPRSAQLDADLVSHVDEVRAGGQRICHVRYEYAAERNGVPSPLPRRFDLVSQTDRSGATRRYGYTQHLLTAYTTYGGFEHRLEWISLGALRARWNVSPLSDESLAELHPITADNSYQARATATRTADGRDEVTIRYVDEDTTRVTEPSGTVFDYTFDENWLAEKVALVPADGSPPQSLGNRVWDRDGMLLEETDALFRIWRYRYDEAGNLVANTDADENTTLLEYDAHNRPARITDALGNATTYEYDDAGNLLATTNALGHTTRFEYGKHGYVSAQIDARGGRNLYSYDAAGRLASQADCSGYRSYYRYDADDNLTTTINALEQETSYSYDAAGQMVRVTHPDATQEHYAYDADGNLVTHTDALGHQTHYRYDGHGMPTERIDALGHSVQYRYDAALRLVELINGNGESYRFSYTPHGWLASETGYDGKVTTYRYDRAGQLLAYESCGVEIRMERDRMGRLALKATPDGCTRYQYDALGRLTAVAAPHAENGFRYDAIGQLLEEHSAYFISEPCPQAYKLRRVPDHYFVMRYAYDELGNRIQTVLPDGHRIDVLRYGSGHWHGVLWDGEPVVDVERDRLHRERRRQIGPKSMGLVATRSYDLMSRVATMVLRQERSKTRIMPVRDRSFSYDPVGNLLNIKDRLNSWDATIGIRKFAYDQIGQLIQFDMAGLSQSFAYDPAGTLDSRISADSNVACYGAQGQLNGMTRDIDAIRVNGLYKYDAFQRRVSKIVITEALTETHAVLSSESTIFLWDGDRILSQISRKEKKTFIFEPESFVPLAVFAESVNDQPAWGYFSCDQVGTPQEMYSGEGEIVWTAELDAWGGKLPATKRRLTDQPLRFQGQYSDSESGLHYNRYRYFDPRKGAYTSDDPLGIQGGTNLRAYPTPTRFADPLGLSKSGPSSSTCASTCCAIVIGETQNRVENIKGQ